MLKIKKSKWQPFDDSGTETIYINPKLIESIEEDGKFYIINLQNGSSYYNIKKFKEVDLKKI